jgi:16S rRNA (cytidine1402-2'-O)-methyltransferase
MPGKIIVISTPIGNLGDLSPRAQEALRSCDVLLCEDTRHTQKLLSHFGIEAKTESFHEHNEREKVEYCLRLIDEGKKVGVVSDAGMPLLSDPGFPLLQAARERGIEVEPIPGPFAAAVALIASGLPPMPFAFFGFPPKKGAERQEFYREILSKRMTSVCYESPHRIIESLEDAATVMGSDTAVTVGREMTKLHEEFVNGSISEVLDILRARQSIPGEITIVLSVPRTDPADRQVSSETLSEEFRALRDSGMRRPDAMKVLAEKHGMPKRELYRLLLEE